MTKRGFRTLQGRGGNVVAMPADHERPIPRSRVREQRDLTARLLAQLDTGELTVGPVGRAYLEGALVALERVLGEPVPHTESSAEASSLQNTND